MKSDHIGTDPGHPRPHELSLSNSTRFSLAVSLCDARIFRMIQSHGTTSLLRCSIFVLCGAARTKAAADSPAPKQIRAGQDRRYRERNTSMRKTVVALTLSISVLASGS